MRIVAVIAASVGVLVLAGTATDAAAQTRGRAPAVSLADAAAQSPSTPAATQRRGLRWNENGRWGLNFNLSQPVGREADWGDVEAGAYYRLSPRLRVGAAANLASPEVDPARAPESSDRRAAPRVRLETIFKF
ncbi:NtrZ family periplasmic regulatory protein [Brevundimonas diminuta]|uniref:NtrZ family periplasmic regulatory protein n=1 Tax=Brevundimonas diminuta TaxID=293 RepID=UPI0032088B2A